MRQAGLTATELMVAWPVRLPEYGAIVVQRNLASIEVAMNWSLQTRLRLPRRQWRLSGIVVKPPTGLAAEPSGFNIFYK